jgi:hypothetical protein
MASTTTPENAAPIFAKKSNNTTGRGSLKSQMKSIVVEVLYTNAEIIKYGFL